MARPERGKRVRFALYRMMKGEVLCMGSSHADGALYWLEPSNRPVGPVTAQKIIARPDVVGANDGFFDGLSQTYRYQEPA